MENKKSTLFKISEMMGLLTPSEKKIGKYIIENPLKTIDLTIECLSEICETSVASVSRFTKKLDFENFYQLKLSIAKEFVSFSEVGYQELGDQTSIKEIYSQIAITNAKIIENSVKSFKSDNFEIVLDKVKEAKHIYFFAMGTSISLALEAWNKFSRLGLKCSFSLDFHSQLLQASTLSDGDLAIVFSHSGINKDIIGLCEVIKKSQANLIGITNYAKTPFEQSVDFCLYFSDNYDKKNKEGFASRIPLIIIIETLYRSFLINIENDKVLKNYQQLFKERSI